MNLNQCMINADQATTLIYFLVGAIVLMVILFFRIMSKNKELKK